MTNEELERAVERLTEDAKRLGCNSSSAVVSKADLRLLLSERAELLAAVERMRGALGTKLAEAKINCNGSKVSVAYADGVIDTYNAARAALTTGEDK